MTPNEDIGASGKSDRMMDGSAGISGFMRWLRDLEPVLLIRGDWF